MVGGSGIQSQAWTSVPAFPGVIATAAWLVEECLGLKR